MKQKLEIQESSFLERKERPGVKERERLSIWDLHWGAASSASRGLCGDLLSVGSMGEEDWVGGKTSCGGSRARERRGLGGAGWSVVPAGETACRQGKH